MGTVHVGPGTSCEGQAGSISSIRFFRYWISSLEPPPQNCISAPLAALLRSSSGIIGWNHYLIKREESDFHPYSFQAWRQFCLVLIRAWSWFFHFLQMNWPCWETVIQQKGRNWGLGCRYGLFFIPLSFLRVLLAF